MINKFDDMNIPEYSDKDFWDKITHKYVKGEYRREIGDEPENQLWNYFKYCLKTGNRYFFEHPLILALKVAFSNHSCVLKEGHEIYRARIDEEHKLRDEWLEYLCIKSRENCEKNTDNVCTPTEDEKTIAEIERIRRIKNRIESGFQGFDAEGSTAPPPEYAVEGRCNPQGVSYLYAALEEHTAVAEIRPFINDTISIGILKPLRDLNLVCLDYDPTGYVSDSLFNYIQMSFSEINKEKNDAYFITQYITSLIKSLGYDGIYFRSSLVKNGTNYVIFKPDDCLVVSSKLIDLYEVNYNYTQYK